MANTVLPWSQYTEAVVGLNHPTLADVDNRSLRATLGRSSFQVDQAFRGLPVGSSAVNAGSSDYTQATAAARVNAAIADAVAAALPYCFVPRVAWDGLAMLPYNASLVTFNTGVRMLREGGPFEYYDVRAYGAAGDANTDDTAAFIGAIGAAGTNKGTVFVSATATSYNVATQAQISNPIFVLGEGLAVSIIKRKTPAAQSIFSVAAAATFSGLTLDGNDPTFATAGQRAIQFQTGSDNTIVRECQIQNFDQALFSGDGMNGKNILIERNYFTVCNYAILMTSKTQVTIFDGLRVINNRFFNISSVAIAIDPEFAGSSCKLFQIIGNRVELVTGNGNPGGFNTGQAISIAATVANLNVSEGIVAYNLLDGQTHGSQGISIQAGVFDLKVIGNIIRNFGYDNASGVGDGINVITSAAGMTGIEIIGNQVNTNKRHGIAFSGTDVSRAAIVASNSCEGNGGCGIITVARQGTVITGNRCRNNGQDGTQTNVNRAGINVDSPQGASVIASNSSSDTQGSPTQQYGFVIGTGSGTPQAFSFVGNSAIGNPSGPYNLSLGGAFSFQVWANMAGDGTVGGIPNAVGHIGLAYSASIQINLTLGDYFTVTVTNGTAFGFTVGGTPLDGQIITVDIFNNSGGVMGAVTWPGTFKLAGAFVNPATGQHRTISFKANGATFYEMCRAAADIPN
jgi:hypothetical protein